MHHVIVGNGIAGISAARVIRQRDDQARISIISDESPYHYARTALMWVDMGQLKLRDTEPFERRFWREQRLELIQDRVTAVQPEQHRVTLERGGELTYDRLLLAVGAEPNRFGWPGQELTGVCHMTTLEHLQQLAAVRPRLRQALVVGGGLIGIELVEMMLHHRVQVSYLLRERWYWDAVLTETEAALVHRRLQAHGVELILEDQLHTIEGDAQGQVRAVRTTAGRELPCQLVGIAVGVRPRIELARAAGIGCERGIVVDQALRTSAPDVYAAGDCAELHLPGQAPRLDQLWYTGIRQGQAAGRAMVGDAVQFEPAVPYNSSQFLFLDYVNVGWMDLAKAPPPARLTGEPLQLDGEQRLGLTEHVFCPANAEESVRIAHLPQSGQVLGFSMLGGRWDAGLLLRWIEERRPLPWVLAQLERARFDEEFRSSAITGVARA